MYRTVLVLLFSIWGAFATAQDFPDPKTKYVNDFANLLGAEVEARLTADLKKLRSEHGIEMTVVTIKRRSDYGASPSIEAFATGLFNQWGVGDAAKNNGIMVLIASLDRDIRIELGSGWAAQYDDRAKVIIDDVFVPWLRDDNWEKGVEAGSLEIIKRFSPGYVPAEGEGRETDDTSWIFVIAVAVMALGLNLRRRIGDASVRLRKCPTCGQRALTRSRTKEREATKEEDGKEAIETTCNRCDYSHRSHRTWTYSSRSSRGGFGGGSSSGGGASGRF